MTDFVFTLNIIVWFSIGIGILFNAILIRWIVRHTPQQMRIYSKILLQTCVTDILLLIVNLLFFPYDFLTEKGEEESILIGLITIKGMENRIWNFLALTCWFFLLNVSMFDYVSQFIFRYFVLVRDKNISSPKYFLLLFLILLFPFAYCIHMFFNLFPPSDHAILDDKSVAAFLGINLDDQIILSSYTFNDARVAIGYCYLTIICTFAYLIIFVLAFRIKQFLEHEIEMHFIF